MKKQKFVIGVVCAFLAKLIKGRLYNLKQLAMSVNFRTLGNIFGSVCVKTGKYGIPVKLVFIRNRNKKSEYIILEWLRLKNNDQKTICELFYVCCDDIQDIDLSTV